MVGFPYNFKKLLKRDDFSGHVNYSAPELILERPDFSDKVDIWALGCCLYFLINKKDPFDGKNPAEVKKNILNFNFEKLAVSSEFQPIHFMLQACFNVEDSLRPSCAQLR